MASLKSEKFQLMAYLAQGILPFEQWSCVFANPELSSRPGLICKAFAVWFPTMLDFLRRSADIENAIAKLSESAEAQEVLRLSRELEAYYKKLLSLYSREEQIFINDRRLQNVHGVLSTFRLDRIHVKHYGKDSDEVVVEHIEADEYHGIMKAYYPEMQSLELSLRDRLVATDQFREFGIFYTSELKAEPHLKEIAMRLGVLAAA
jgi:hypothetical protein